ncbi:mechanosensitive ion channel family protein [Chitinophagaceae bacterium LWZ2-11]
MFNSAYMISGICINKRLIACIAILLSATPLLSQNNDKQPAKIKSDSIIISKLADSVKAKLKFSDTSVALLLRKTEEVTQMFNTSKSLLQRGFDTADISSELPGIQEMLENISNNYNNPRLLNLRGLKNTKTLLTDNSDKLQLWQKKLFGYSDQLTSISSKLNAVVKDSTFRNLPEDTTLQNLYLKQIRSLTKEWQSIDSINKKSMLKIGLMQNNVANAFIRNNQLSDETNYHIKNFTKQLWHPEEKVIWKARTGDYEGSLGSIANHSTYITKKILSYYIENNPEDFIIEFLLAVLLFAWVIVNIKKIKKNPEDAQTIFSNAPNVSKHPVIAAIVVVFTLVPFLFNDPPPSFIILTWTVLSVLYTRILWKDYNNRQKKIWLTFLFLFIIYNSLNLLLKSTFIERWSQIGIDIFSVLFALYVIKNYKEELTLFTKYGTLILYLFIILIFIGFICNVSGCFILSKYFSSSAAFAVISAQAFFICIKIIVEFVYLHYEAYKKQSKLVAYFEFNKIKQGLINTLTVIAWLGWFAVLAKNLNFYDILFDGAEGLLFKQRKLGNITFDFWSIFIFGLIIWLSTFISKLILILFGNKGEISPGQKSRWGSSVILIRLFVLGVGIMLAFAASGIPLDKITIIIGALGVGIGFGLQNIVNNLVSGVILALERPIQVGDKIEVDTKYGTVKEIGIRSSKLLTNDGSEVIIPNGDLLSKHIVNWTLSNNYKRLELTVGVGYGSNLKQVKELLLQVLKDQKSIERIPEPLVFTDELGDSSINFKLYFWCDLYQASSIKSEALQSIYDKLNEHSIEIPFPQMDVHLKGEGGES